MLAWVVGCLFCVCMRTGECALFFWPSQPALGVCGASLLRTVWSHSSFSSRFRASAGTPLHTPLLWLHDNCQSKEQECTLLRSKIRLSCEMKAVGVFASIDSPDPHASISTVAADKSFLRLRFCRRWPDFLIPHPASCCLLGWLAVFLCLHAHGRVCIFLLALPARPGGVRSLRSAPGLVLVPLPVTLACASLSSLLWALHVDSAGKVKSKNVRSCEAR